MVHAGGHNSARGDWLWQTLLAENGPGGGRTAFGGGTLICMTIPPIWWMRWEMCGVVPTSLPSGERREMSMVWSPWFSLQEPCQTSECIRTYMLCPVPSNCTCESYLCHSWPTMCTTSVSLQPVSDAMAHVCIQCECVHDCFCLSSNVSRLCCANLVSGDPYIVLEKCQ